jgi:hypothetical protein
MRILVSDALSEPLPPTLSQNSAKWWGSLFRDIQTAVEPKVASPVAHFSQRRREAGHPGWF